MENSIFLPQVRTTSGDLIAAFVSGEHLMSLKGKMFAEFGDILIKNIANEVAINEDDNSGELSDEEFECLKRQISDIRQFDFMNPNNGDGTSEFDCFIDWVLHSGKSDIEQITREIVASRTHLFKVEIKLVSYQTVYVRAKDEDAASDYVSNMDSYELSDYADFSDFEVDDIEDIMEIDGVSQYTSVIDVED